MKASNRFMLSPATLTIASTVALAEPAANTLPIETEPLDHLWSYAKLYHEPDNVFFKSLTLSGRLQGESARFDGDQGSLEDASWRRFRFGAKAQLSDEWQLHVEGDFNLNEGLDDAHIYNRLTDAKVTWKPKSKAWRLTLLKQGTGFTLDGATSSKTLLTPERNNLSNNLWFTAEYFSGVSISGTLPANQNTGELWYQAGIFSSDGDEEIGISEASYFTLTSVSADFSNHFNADKAVIRADYVYNDEHEDANTRDFSQVASINSQWQQGNWGLSTDIAFGEGYGNQGDVFGLVLMPHYRVNEYLELVTRYTWMDGHGEQSLRLNRYDRDLGEGRGDQYSEGYVGVNLYFYRHKLKWQTGLQYADMNDKTNSGGDYHGWGVITGFRIYW